MRKERAMEEGPRECVVSVHEVGAFEHPYVHCTHRKLRPVEAERLVTFVPFDAERLLHDTFYYEGWTPAGRLVWLRRRVEVGELFGVAEWTLTESWLVGDVMRMTVRSAATLGELHRDYGALPRPYSVFRFYRRAHVGEAFGVINLDEQGRVRRTA